MIRHNSFICNPHLDGCECPDREHTWCNPYSLEGYCPTRGQGEDCRADATRLVIEAVPGGFTYGLKGLL